MPYVVLFKTSDFNGIRFIVDNYLKEIQGKI